MIVVPHTNNAEGATITVPQDEKTWMAHTPLKVDKGVVLFDVDKRENLMLAMPNVAAVSFEYETDGNFLVSSSSLTPGGEQIDYLFSERKKIWSGTGRVEFDLRRTIGWSPGSRPMLIFEGTGNFRIRNLAVTTPANLRDYSAEKGSAFFWKPISIWHTTINFITPAYWDVNRNISFSLMLGVSYLVLVVVLIFARLYSKKIKTEKFAVLISLTGVCIFALHFAFRLAPSVNYNILDSNEEKIKLNYYYPEFGILVSKAREIIGTGDTVAVMYESGDWFSPEAFCFNIVPERCVFYEPDNDTLFGNPWPGLPTYVKADINSVNAIVSYNSAYPLPVGFRKVYELNRNVFIARKE